jgi:hypothetical protein
VGVGSRFHFLRSRTCFRRNRVCRVPFSCFALPISISAVPRASSPFFIFCAPGLIFDDKGRQILFSCFAFPDSFSAVPRASVVVFIFCAPKLIFGDIVGVRFLFHVLRSWTHFRRYRGRRVPFSCFALPDSFFGGT